MIGERQLDDPYLKVFPLSRNQERMWFLEKISLNKSIYHNPSVIRIEGPLNIDQLEKACAFVIEKHPQLRAVMREIKHETFQCILPSLPLSFSKLNLENSPELVESTIQEIVRKPFNLSEGPLINFTLIQIKQNSFILVFNLHHLISDGWSKSILLKDLLAVYLRQSPQLFHPYSYQDFVEHQISNPIHNQSWKEIYSKKIEPLMLGSKQVYSHTDAGHGALFRFQFEKSLSDQVIAFAKENEITPFTFLLSVFSIFLFRISGQKNFAIGSPVSGRMKKEWEDIVGFFVNTVAIPIHIESDLTFLDYLLTLKDRVLKVLSNQSLPFEEVVKYLNPIREAHQNPIFQVMFQYDHFPLPSLQLGELSFSPQTLDFGIAQMDLSLTIWQEQRTLCGTLEYKTVLFDQPTIECFHSYFISLIESILENPREKLTKLKLISKKEEEIICKINATECELPYQNYLMQFKRMATLYPDQFAVIYNKYSLNFKELERKSNQLAQCLQKKGINADSKVALILPTSIETIIGMVALSKIGALFTIIDPYTPLKRQKQLLELFHPNLVISDSNEIATFLKENDDKNFDPYIALPEEHALCVIFTSGTTGEPKGVVLHHLALANIAHSFIHAYQVNTHDKILALSSVSSASFLGEVIPSLCAGATLVLTDYQTYLDETKLINFIEEYGVTILSTVPSFIKQLNSHSVQPKSLRYLLSGGEALFAKHMSNLKPPLKIVNSYGLTEATICSSYEIIDPAHTVSNTEFTLGKPIFNTKLHVLDEYGNIAPIGYPGEIGISGMGLMKGYLHEPLLTQQAIVEDPLDKTKRMLLTKDIGIRLSSGNICYVGRQDHQTKIRGFRINLLEIEKTILESDLVENVVVKTMETSNGLQLIAAVEAKPETKIKQWLRDRLPHYMIPSEIHILEKIPYNQNGKVDWIEIQKNFTKQKTQNPPSFYLLSSIEKQLSLIWQRVLEKEEIDIDQNFFDLGGHSILLMNVHHAIKQEMHQEIEIVHLFKFPTIRSLAEYIQTQGKQSEKQTDGMHHRAMMQKKAIQENRKKIENSRNI